MNRLLREPTDGLWKGSVMGQPQDRTRFPLLWVAPLDANISLLPITKIQFEQFLCETVDSRFGPQWYDEVLELNPRIEVSKINPSNYWRAFITGILPEEAECFARWMGDGYRLLTAEEWVIAYEYLRDLKPIEVEWEQELESPSSRCLTVLRGMEGASTAVALATGCERSLADQMLLKRGVIEWVRLSGREGQWGGFGEVAPGLGGLIFDLEQGEPHRPLYPRTERIPYYGFRLIREERS